ncbi:LOW QUALITY PROTEIN: hypothetical protein SETIT_1G070300v2 [Setaria italica]|uniref:Uncharacterized protein n=1 Tax=Setaria italica TaxID=4555 RepID=A0A368PHN2_SETIT|nr:LOW QUALITY PROTEIN: hypothetical protein SETIT_1G070300v2 [Setaria italica]
MMPAKSPSGWWRARGGLLPGKPRSGARGAGEVAVDPTVDRSLEWASRHGSELLPAAARASLILGLWLIWIEAATRAARRRPATARWRGSGMPSSSRRQRRQWSRTPPPCDTIRQRTSGRNRRAAVPSSTFPQPRRRSSQLPEAHAACKDGGGREPFVSFIPWRAPGLLHPLAGAGAAGGGRREKARGEAVEAGSRASTAGSGAHGAGSAVWRGGGSLPRAGKCLSPSVARAAPGVARPRAGLAFGRARSEMTGYVAAQGAGRGRRSGRDAGTDNATDKDVHDGAEDGGSGMGSGTASEARSCCVSDNVRSERRRDRPVHVTQNGDTPNVSWLVRADDGVEVVAHNRSSSAQWWAGGREEALCVRSEQWRLHAEALHKCSGVRMVGLRSGGGWWHGVVTLRGDARDAGAVAACEERRLSGGTSGRRPQRGWRYGDVVKTLSRSWTSDGGAIGVVPSLEASCLETQLGLRHCWSIGHGRQ